MSGNTNLQRFRCRFGICKEVPMKCHWLHETNWHSLLHMVSVEHQDRLGSVEIRQVLYSVLVPRFPWVARVLWLELYKKKMIHAMSNFHFISIILYRIKFYTFFSIQNCWLLSKGKSWKKYAMNQHLYHLDDSYLQIHNWLTPTDRYTFPSKFLKCVVASRILQLGTGFLAQRKLQMKGEWKVWFRRILRGSWKYESEH